MRFSCFSVSQGSAETLFRWGGKITYFLIAYSLLNVCAKSYKNRTIRARVIAKNVGDPFLRHSVIIPFTIIKHPQLQYGGNNTTVVCLIYQLANAKFSWSCQIWLRVSVRCPQLNASWLPFPYREGYPATVDILHAFGGVMLIKVPLLPGTYGLTNHNN